MKKKDLIDLVKKSGAILDYPPWWFSSEEQVKEVLQSIKNPKWQETTRIMDWRNHVGIWQECWDKLSFETRFVIYYNARKEADKENWD